jgi:SAM-dependent methyltransferase
MTSLPDTLRQKIRPARAAARATALAGARIAYRGDSVTCPCCRSSFDRFVPRHWDTQCPSCRSLERHRVAMLYLDGHLKLLERRVRVLHVAPEESLHQWLSQLPLIDYVTGDLEPGPRVEVQLDVTDLPFADAEFDLVICNHVLEHVDDDESGMNELRRVLKPGGMALIQCPVDPSRSETYEDPAIRTPEERAEAFHQADHVRVYGVDFPERLESAGFTVQRVDYAEMLPEDALDVYGIAPHRHGVRGDEIFACRVASAG